MPITVRVALDQMNCVYDLPNDILDTNVGSRNTHEVTFVMPCSHKKTCKASSLAKPDQCCKTCKLLDEFGYDPDNCTLTCKKCQIVSHEVPRTNLNKFTCIHCMPDDCSVEHQAFKMFHECLKDGEYITRSCQYPGDTKKRTADMKLVLDGQEFYVEIDDKSHLSKHGSKAHLEKDLCAKENSIQIVRIFGGDVCEETVDKTINFLRLWSDSFSTDDPIIVVDSAEALNFFSHKKLGYSFDRDYSMIFWKNGSSFFGYEAPAEREETLDEPEETHDEPEEEEDLKAHLSQEIEQRVLELCEWADSLEEGTEEHTKLIGLIESGCMVAFMYEYKEDDEERMLKLVKNFLYSATSLLLFNKRSIKLMDNQKIEEKDIEKSAEVQQE